MQRDDSVHEAQRSGGAQGRGQARDSSGTAARGDTGKLGATRGQREGSSAHNPPSYTQKGELLTPWTFFMAVPAHYSFEA